MGSFWWFWLLVLGIGVQSAERKYKLCIPQTKSNKPTTLQKCNDLMENVNRFGTNFECVIAIDRAECIRKMNKAQADFVAVERIEDFYLMDKYYHGKFSVVREVRQHAHEKRNLSTEIVMVVRNDQRINTLSDLRGKRACLSLFHNDVISAGREKDYILRTVMGRLMEENILSEKCGAEMSVVERKLASLSEFFGSSCAPGDWTPVYNHTKELKEKYKNLCSLCYNSDCGKLDAHAGTFGDIRCLEFEGDMAVTTIDSLQIRYDDEEGRKSARSTFSFMCPNGRKMQLNVKKVPSFCIWGGSPWGGFVARNALGSDSLDELQQQLDDLFQYPYKDPRVSIAMYDIFGSNIAGGIGVVMQPPRPVSEHLKPAHYGPSIDRPLCETEPRMKICVHGGEEMRKCETLKQASWSWWIRPKLECVQGESSVSCLRDVRDGRADVTLADPALAFEIDRNEELIPILAESYYGGTDLDVVVALVRRGSGIEKLEDLKGKKSCHAINAGNDLAWNIPVHLLKEKGLISRDSCTFESSLREFFSASCVYGNQLATNDTRWGNPNSLCDACKHGNNVMCPERKHWEGIWTEGEAYKCLSSGLGDVAFVAPNEGLELFFKPPGGLSGLNMSENDYQLVCGDGSGVKEIKEYFHCNWGVKPNSKVVVAAKNRKQYELDNFSLALFEIGFKFEMSSWSSFKFFASYEGKPNLIVDNSLPTNEKFRYLPQNWTNLMNHTEDTDPYFSMAEKMSACESKSNQISSDFILLITLICVQCWMR